MYYDLTKPSFINYKTFNHHERQNAFLFKTQPAKGFFYVDMTDEERGIMQKHVAFWNDYINDGTVIVLGPVMDPKGGYGIAVVSVDSEDQLNQIIAKDPSNGMSSYEVYPMRAVTKQH